MEVCFSSIKLDRRPNNEWELHSMLSVALEGGLYVEVASCNLQTFSEQDSNSVILCHWTEDLIMRCF